MLPSDPETAVERLRQIDDFPAFKAFAAALWRNEAAVMVGAGFSQMCRREPDSPIPPLWRDFASRMQCALGYDANRAPDPLRMAEEYRTMHGEDGLDRLITELIPDGRWTPGEAHKQLLELPWQDVLTTNWDTLLERTTPTTPDRIYQTVFSVQDIAQSSRPRIVKLHGSLPSHKPLIFTEDDYRTYPQRFAPFVNLAQQVMLENELCLVGFSGVDPNFLAWSGWVRDTLGAAARRIRLIGVLNLSSASRSLLEDRHVTPIDLAPLVKDVPDEERHQVATRLFLSALIGVRPPSPFEWDKRSRKVLETSSPKEADKPTRAEVVTAWQSDRERYPGWLVAPRRQTYELQFGPSLVRTGDDLNETRLNFAAESIWRHRTNRLIPNFNDLQDADTAYDDNFGCLSLSMRRDLCAFAAAEMRKYERWDDWSRWLERLDAIGGDEATRRYHYETALRALRDWEDESVANAADALRSDEPIWRMRRASLLAALSHDREAAQLYEAALRHVRMQLLEAPDSAWLISLEGWASMFYRASYSALTGNDFDWPENDSEETRMRFVRAKADPWEIVTELEDLASKRILRNRNDNKEWELRFDPGHFRAGGVNRIGGDGECPFYGLLEVIERVGAPESISRTNMFSSRLATAYEALSKPDEGDLLAFLSRYRGNDKKLLDRILRRVDLARLSDDVVLKLLNAIPLRVDRLMALPNGGNTVNHIVFLLDLMSRVVVRAKAPDASIAFDWAANLTKDVRLWWGQYQPLDLLLQRSVEPMAEQERQHALKTAIALPTPEEGKAKGPENDWPEVLGAFSGSDIEAFNVGPQTSVRIDSLVGLAGSAAALTRGRAIGRLHRLNEAGKLSQPQQLAFAQAIWESPDASGWPRDAKLHPWVYLDLPGSEHAETLFVEHILKGVAAGKIDVDNLMNLRAGLQYSKSDFPKDSLIACVSTCLNWNPEPPERDDPLKFASSQRDAQNRAIGRQIGHTLSKGLLPKLSTADIPDEIKEKWWRLERLRHIPSMSATAYQMSRYWPEELPRATKIIRAAVASRDRERAYPAYQALDRFLDDQGQGADFPDELRTLVIETCEQRAQPGLEQALCAARRLVSQDLVDAEETERLSVAVQNVLEEYHYDQENLPVPSLSVLPLVRKHALGLITALNGRGAGLEDLQNALLRDPLPEVRSGADAATTG